VWRMLPEIVYVTRMEKKMYRGEVYSSPRWWNDSEDLLASIEDDIRTGEFEMSKPYSEMTSEEILADKRQRCYGRHVQIMQWSDEAEKAVVVAEGTIIDVTRIDAPDMVEIGYLSPHGDGKINGYVVELTTGEQQTCRMSDLHWLKQD
jgi:hypothetical protein